MNLTTKQTEALDILEDDFTEELIFGGGAGGAKSFLGCYWVLKNCMKYPGTRWVIGRKELKQLKRSTLQSFFDVCKLQGIIKDEHYIYREQAGEINFTNGSQILLVDLMQNPSDRDYDGFGSLEITGAFIDEVNQVPEVAWEAVKSRIRYKLDENNLMPKILGTCNPSKNWVYQRFYKPQKDGTIEVGKRFIQALVTDNPFISKHYIKNLESQSKARKDRLLYGIWEQEDDDALMAYDSITNIFTNAGVVDYNSKKYITCDVARMGSDKAVIMVWHGFQVIEVYSYAISKINDLQALIIALKIKHNVGNSNIVIDEDGVGGGLVDFIKGCKGFVNNSTPLMGENYQNLKTQCYYKLAEAVNANGIYISAELSIGEKELIIEELEQVKSTDTDTDGKLKIISKAQVKQNIGRSPDFADNLAMRMIFELTPKRNSVVY